MEGGTELRWKAEQSSDGRRNRAQMDVGTELRWVSEQSSNRRRNRAQMEGRTKHKWEASVADPNPDPSDPHDVGPPGSGSGSISQSY
jgi:hypothetical protein